MEGKENRCGDENEKLNTNGKKITWIARARRKRRTRRREDYNLQRREGDTENVGKQISQRSDDVNIALYCNGLCAAQWFIGFTRQHSTRRCVMLEHMRVYWTSDVTKPGTCTCFAKTKLAVQDFLDMLIIVQMVKMFLRFKEFERN
jgi:hypothetical protein